MTGSSDKGSKTLLYVGAGLAAVGIGAAVYCATRSGEKVVKQVEDDFSSKGATKEVPTPAPAPKATKPEAAKEAAKPSQPTTAEPPMPTPPPGHYPQLGIALTLSNGWQAQEELAPVPNVAMVALNKAEFAGKQAEVPGETPVVLISAEDISQEGLTVEEFLEKTKMMAVQQMMMMTQGMFQPNIEFEGAKACGPFTHCLQYAQNTPFFQMKVLNLIAVEKGIAYIFQLMVNPGMYDRIADEVQTLAKSMTLNPPSPDADGNSYVTIADGTARVKAPAMWCFDNSAAAAQKNPAFQLVTPSVMKPDTIAVYNDSWEGAWSKPDRWSEQGARTTDQGAVVTRYRDGSGRTHVVVTGGNGVTVVLSPKNRPSPVVTEELVVKLWATVSVDNAAAAARSLRYTSKLGFEMDIEKGSRLMESRLGERTIVYAPMGLPDQQSQEEGPILTIRVGDPSNDEDCRATLDEWEARIKEDAQESLSELRRETHNGHKCLAFTNKEMQEVAPGQREERIAKVFVFLQGITTTMLRWEAPSGAHRKFEGRLNKILASFALL